MPNSRASGLLALGLAAALLGGSLFFLDRHMAEGNSYPPYSTLRAGPYGCKLLYDSLAAVPGLLVRRNYLEPALYHPGGTTVIIAGIPEYALLTGEGDSFARWERLAQNNRVLLAIAPEDVPLESYSSPERHLLKTRWHVELAPMPAGKNLWHRSFEAGPEWRILETAAGRPVVLERQFGQGQIVLAADSWPFANGALAEISPSAAPEAATSPAMLSRVFGSRNIIEFDEAHLGMAETGTLLGLARRYRLQGLLAGLAALTVLFIWHTSVRFPSVLAEEEAVRHTAAVAGRDAQQGFLRLLQRNIPPGELVAVCVDEWRRTSPRSPRLALLEAARSRLSSNDPVLAYRALRQSLDKKETHSL